LESSSSTLAFVSYAHRDADQVLPAVKALEAALPEWTWFVDCESLRLGDSWMASLDRAVETCHVFIPFFSAYYVERAISPPSPIATEFEAIRIRQYEEDPPPRITPVVIEPVSIPPSLSRFQYFDLSRFSDVTRTASVWVPQLLNELTGKAGSAPPTSSTLIVAEACAAVLVGQLATASELVDRLPDRVQRKAAWYAIWALSNDLAALNSVSEARDLLMQIRCASEIPGFGIVARKAEARLRSMFFQFHGYAEGT
jgi:hypothetical protein